MIRLPSNYLGLDRNQATLHLLDCHAGKVYVAYQQIGAIIQELPDYWEYFHNVKEAFVGGITIVLCEDNSVLVFGDTVEVFTDFTEFMDTMFFGGSTLDDLHKAEQEFLIWACGSEAEAEEYIANN